MVYSRKMKQGIASKKENLYTVSGSGRVRTILSWSVIQRIISRFPERKPELLLILRPFTAGLQVFQPSVSRASPQVNGRESHGTVTIAGNAQACRLTSLLSQLPSSPIYLPHSSLRRSTANPRPSTSGRHHPRSPALEYLGEPGSEYISGGSPGDRQRFMLGASTWTSRVDLEAVGYSPQLD